MGQFADLRTQYFLQLADLRFADPNLLRTYNFRKSENSLFFLLTQRVRKVYAARKAYAATLV